MTKTPHISLDLQKDFSPTIDISENFVASEIHAINNGRFKKTLDEILPFRENLDLQSKKDLEIDDFYHFPILDITLPELIESSFWQKKFPELRLRQRIINLNPSLEIPFGSIDIRTEKIHRSSERYADIFIRKLSPKLRLRRVARHTKFFYNRHSKKILYVFSLIFLLIFPTVFYVKFSIENAYNTLLSLKNISNISELQAKTRSARGDFERASFLFAPFSWIPLETVDLASRAIYGGKEISRAIDDVAHLFPSSSENFSLKIIDNSDNSLYRGNSKDIFPGENLGVSLPTNFLADKSKEIFSAFSALESAGKIYKEVKGNSEYAHKMRQVGTILENISPFLKKYQENHEILLTMLGHKDPERYIVFNQNRDEIRANGGFPGSIITFTLYKGNILDYRTDDVYYYDWNLFPHKEAPPPGIALLTDNYGLRDVNYYPDFLKTLEKANSFVEKSGDPTLTTGIAIHQGLIEEILAITGEVEVEGVQEKFSADNFSVLMSLLVENKFARDKTPKDILFKFISAFGKKIVESRKIQEISEVIQDSWNRGEILMASRNDEIQQFLREIQKPLPWHSEDKNWVYPIFTSVSGNKSDRYINRTIQATTRPLGNCRYETSVQLTLQHNFSKDDENFMEKLMNTFDLKDKKEREKMRFIQGNGKNKNFIRLFVPKGAELIGSGAEISTNDEATIFAFMMETSVGAKTTKNISYRQEIPHCADYKEEISVYRQPGLKNLFIQ